MNNSWGERAPLPASGGHCAAERGVPRTRSDPAGLSGGASSSLTPGSSGPCLGLTNAVGSPCQCRSPPADQPAVQVQLHRRRGGEDRAGRGAHRALPEVCCPPDPPPRSEVSPPLAGPKRGLILAPGRRRQSGLGVRGTSPRLPAAACSWGGRPLSDSDPLEPHRAGVLGRHALRGCCGSFHSFTQPVLLSSYVFTF